MTRQITANEIRPGDQIQVEYTVTATGEVAHFVEGYGLPTVSFTTGQTTPVAITEGDETSRITVTLLDRRTPTGLYQAPGGSVLFYDGVQSMNVRTGNAFSAEPGDEFTLIQRVEVPEVAPTLPAEDNHEEAA